MTGWNHRSGLRVCGRLGLMLGGFYAMVVGVVILGSWAGCKPRKSLPAGEIWAAGFHSIRWGQSPSALDSLLATDSSWILVDQIANLRNGGTTAVIKHGDRDYYLDFNVAERLTAVSYISRRSDLDSLLGRLSVLYGEPDRMDSQTTYSSKEWVASNDSMKIKLQLLTTQNLYSFCITNLSSSR